MISERPNKEYIDVPDSLSEKVFISEYGAAAFRFYKQRIEERKLQGRIYLKPIKTMYIWAAQDRKTYQGYWSTWNGAVRKNTKITEEAKQ